VAVRVPSNGKIKKGLQLIFFSANPPEWKELIEGKYIFHVDKTESGKFIKVNYTKIGPFLSAESSPNVLDRP
jgi:hypothetical protein